MAAAHLWILDSGSALGTSVARCEETSLESDLHLISQAWVWMRRHDQFQPQEGFVPVRVPKASPRKSRQPHTGSFAAPQSDQLAGFHQTDAVAHRNVSRRLVIQPSRHATGSNRSSRSRSSLISDPTHNVEIDFNSEHGFIYQAKRKKKGGTSSSNAATHNTNNDNHKDDREGGGGRDRDRDRGGHQGGGGSGRGGSAGAGDDENDKDKDKDTGDSIDESPTAAESDKKRKTQQDDVEADPDSTPDAAPDPPDVFDDVQMSEVSAGKHEVGLHSADNKSLFGAWSKWNTTRGWSGSSTGNFHGIDPMEKKLSVDATPFGSGSLQTRKQDMLDPLSHDDDDESRRIPEQSQEQLSTRDRTNGDLRNPLGGLKKSKRGEASEPLVTQAAPVMIDWPAPGLSAKDKRKKKGAIEVLIEENSKPDLDKEVDDAWGICDASKRERKTVKEVIAPTVSTQFESELANNVWDTGTAKDKKTRKKDRIAEAPPEPEPRQDPELEPDSVEAEDPWGLQSKPSKKDRRKKPSPITDVVPEQAPDSIPEPVPLSVYQPPKQGVAEGGGKEEEEEEESGGLWAALSGKKDKKKKKPDVPPSESIPRESTDDFWDNIGAANKDIANAVASPPPPVEKDEGWSFWGFGSRKKKTEAPVPPPVEVPRMEKPQPELARQPLARQEQEQESRQEPKKVSEELPVKKRKEEPKAEPPPEQNLDDLNKKDKKEKKSSTKPSREEPKSRSKSKRESAYDIWGEPVILSKQDKKKGTTDVTQLSKLEIPLVEPLNDLAPESSKTFGNDESIEHGDLLKTSGKIGVAESWKPDGVKEPIEDPWASTTEFKGNKSNGHPVEVTGVATGETVQSVDVEEIKDDAFGEDFDWTWALSNRRKPKRGQDASPDPPLLAPTPPSLEFIEPKGQAEDPNVVAVEETPLTKLETKSKDKEVDKEKEKPKKDKTPKLTEREMKKLERERKKAEKAEKERLEREAREAEEQVRREAEELAAQEAAEIMAKEAEERAAREAKEELAKEAEERAAREAEEEAACEAEREAAEQAAKAAEAAAAIIAEEEEMKALAERKARRGRLNRRETERLHLLEENALRRAEEQAAREAEEKAAREAEEAAREAEEKAAREAEEEAAREAQAAVIAQEEEEMAALKAKRAKRGTLRKKDMEKLDRLEENALRRAEEKAAREAEQARLAEAEAEEELEQGEEDEERDVDQREREGEGDEEGNAEEKEEEKEEGQEEEGEEGEMEEEEEEEGKELDVAGEVEEAEEVEKVEEAGAGEEENHDEQWEDPGSLDDQETEEQRLREAEELAAREAEEKAARQAAREAEKKAKREAEEAAAASKRSKKSSKSKEKEREKDRRKEKEKEREKEKDRRRDKKARHPEPVPEPVPEPQLKPQPEPVEEPEEEPEVEPDPEPTSEPEAKHEEHERELSELNEDEVEELLSPKETATSHAFNFWGLAGSNQKKKDVGKTAAMDEKSNDETLLRTSRRPMNDIIADRLKSFQQGPDKVANPTPSPSPPPSTNEAADEEHLPLDEEELDEEKEELPLEDEQSSDKEVDHMEELPVEKSASGDEPKAEAELLMEGGQSLMEREAPEATKNQRSADFPGSFPVEDAEDGIIAIVEPASHREGPRGRERERDRDKEKKSSKKQRHRIPLDEMPPRPPPVPDPPLTPPAEPKPTKLRSHEDKGASWGRSSPPLREEKRSSKAKVSSSQPRASTTSHPPMARSRSTRERQKTVNNEPVHRYFPDPRGFMSTPPEDIPDMPTKAARILGTDKPISRQRSHRRNPQDEDDIVMVGALGDDGKPPHPQERRRSRRSPDRGMISADAEMRDHGSKRATSSSKKRLSGLFGFMAPKASRAPAYADIGADAGHDYLRESRRIRKSEREDMITDDMRRKEERDRERRRRHRDESEARRQAEKDARRERRTARQREEEAERRAQDEREARRAERHRLRREREREEEEAHRKSKRQRQRSQAGRSGDEAERQRRHEARRASRAAEESDANRGGSGRNYDEDDHVYSSKDRRREMRKVQGPAAWPHSGTSSWVKEHSDVPPPVDKAEQTEGVGLTEDEARREARRAQRRRERRGESGIDERRDYGREGREREIRSREVRGREVRDREMRDREFRDRDIRDRDRDRDREVRDRDGRERTRRNLTSDGSDERRRSRRTSAAAEPTPRSSWWKKLTG